MKFKSGTRRKPIDYEKALVTYWKDNRIFEKSVQNRPADQAYVFYDGPPFITGAPHLGTLLSSIIKDAVPRYQTMKGHRVERVWGWDCHGLPAEVYTEQKLGITDKRDIGTKISLEDYIIACRENMVQTGDAWESTIERIGRWVDFKGAYKTMDKDFMESVWWAFKQLYDKGKIYEGEKVLLYCTRDATPLSKAEVAMDNSYKEITDPSVFVKYKLAGGDEYLLVWTTTPWTLPSNTAVAVNKDINYDLVEVDSQKLILAASLVSRVMTDEKHQPLIYKTLKTFKGQELVGKSYQPLFEVTSQLEAINPESAKNAFKVWHAGFVNEEEGTGIAHESPAYGEDDYILAKNNQIPMLLNTDEEGFYKYGEWRGRQVWEVNKEIAKTMFERGDIWKVDYFTHPYPHCHRCGTRLMYRAHPSWFMDIDGQKQAMLEKNGSINWFPAHIKHGRFAKTVESAPDWNLSRDRFWATAMPVWKAVGKDGKELIKVVGSYAELKELSGQELKDYHRPWIDDVTFKIDGLAYKRVDKVMDSWFEAGSMPFAQFHYPFENVQKFESAFPGDFIAEYVAQVRTWFYYLHAVSIGLFDTNSFNNVIVTGTIAGSDGRKMSKQFGNYTDPNLLMDNYSADALRYLFLSSPLLNGEDYIMQDKNVSDVHRKLAMVWNMFDFFTLYAEVDGWQWEALAVGGQLDDPSADCQNLLDEWIVSRLHQLISDIDRHMAAYDVPGALEPVLPFIDDASNWYVRRSRKRFWKSSNDQDKSLAYRVLHYVLVQLSLALAPFTPFLSEELFLKLTGGKLGESVHLLDWPKAGRVNELLLQHMAQARNYIAEGLAIRAALGIKVRQPLSSVTVPELPELFKEIIMEELNVKSVQWGDKLELDSKVTDELKAEGLIREVIRQIQKERKNLSLHVDDRINIELFTQNNQLLSALKLHQDAVKTETLADKIELKSTINKVNTVQIEGIDFGITLHKI